MLEKLSKAGVFEKGADGVDVGSEWLRRFRWADEVPKGRNDLGPYRWCALR